MDRPKLFRFLKAMLHWIKEVKTKNISWSKKPLYQGSRIKTAEFEEFEELWPHPIIFGYKKIQLLLIAQGYTYIKRNLKAKWLRYVNCPSKLVANMNFEAWIFNDYYKSKMAHILNRTKIKLQQRNLSGDYIIYCRKQNVKAYNAITWLHKCCRLSVS